MEGKVVCPAFQSMMRGDDDWNEYYQAWKHGRTGFLFKDSCMRCLINHRWQNFWVACNARFIRNVQSMVGLDENKWSFSQSIFRL